MLVCDLSSVKVETQTCSYIGQFTDLEEPVFLCHQINIKFLNMNYLWEGLSEWWHSGIVNDISNVVGGEPEAVDSRANLKD